MRPDASKKIAAAAPKKGPNPVIIGAVIAAVVIIAVVVAIVIGTSGKSDGTAASAQPSGAVATDAGGILANTVPAKSNAPTLDLYEDFQCPNCGQFEKAVGPTITTMVEAGDVKLIVHTLSFLDDNLKNGFSKKTANAVACAADAGKFLPYHAAVFAAQPTQEGAGYTDAQITEFATTAGITGPALTTWEKCNSTDQHAQYVLDTQTAAEKARVNSTPTLQLDGKDITQNLPYPFGPATAEALVAQIKAATK